ncbi:hypothetical protein SLS62_003921 [Diatrype stigma]|uniref:Uncharacterized protein n=1 Tax=Diatrype stigma TaxID=117547 RepID=A0AAN9UXK5_9PEZI
MGLRDLLKKKDQLEGAGSASATAETLEQLRAGPEFTFIRSDTHTQEIIHPPTLRGENHHQQQQQQQYLKSGSGSGSGKTRRSLDVFRPGSSSRSRPSSSSSATRSDYLDAAPPPGSGKQHRRLSQRLHLSRGKTPASSDYVPGDLPQISITGDGGGDRSEREWEKRATMLAQAADANERRRSRSPSIQVGVTSPVPEITGLDLGGRFGDAAAEFGGGGGGSGVGGGAQPPPPSSPRGTSNHSGVVSSQTIDQNIQEAIRLHEEGELEHSTALFGHLADPQGANNPLSQVLYGLALRHGWGCQPDPGRAVSYLSAAASNAAEVERMALQAGLSKGGAAKGELILAIFELANCFRNGWGVDRDPVAAKQYAAARYYRLAEENGNKTLGNSW